MSKHVWEWDKKNDKPMIVVCIKCGKKMTLSEVLEVGCDGCPVEGVQEELFSEPKD
jgi:uncharacterized CHY-type Zn-finger protein